MGEREREKLQMSHSESIQITYDVDVSHQFNNIEIVSEKKQQVEDRAI